MTSWHILCLIILYIVSSVNDQSQSRTEALIPLTAMATIYPLGRKKVAYYYDGKITSDEWHRLHDFECVVRAISNLLMNKYALIIIPHIY